MTGAFCAGVGLSTGRDPSIAGRSAARAALKQAGGASCDFVFVFATANHPQPELLAAVREATGNVPTAGCTGAGVIARSQRAEGSSAVAVVACSGGPYRLRNAIAIDAYDDPAAAGAALAQALGPLPEDARALLLFSDGTSVDVERIVGGLQSSLPRPLPVFGAKAGGTSVTERTYQYHDDRVVSGAVTAVLIAGPGAVVIESSPSCVPVGRLRTVTRADGRSIYELDGKPVTELLEDYLGREAMAQVPCHVAFALFDEAGNAGPRTTTQHADFLTRAIRRIDPVLQRVETFARIQEGARVSLAIRDAAALWEGIEAMGERLRLSLGDRAPQAVFHFESFGRARGFLREEERQRVVTRLQELVGVQVPWCGFSSYGEIAPSRSNGQLHDYASVIAALT